MEVIFNTSSWDEVDNIRIVSPIAESGTEESIWENQVISTSVFTDLGGLNVPAIKTELPQAKLQKGFVSILANRLNYLGGLEALQPGWISGGGKVPSARALSTSSSLLRHIQNRAKSELLSVIPNLVIGPLPSGGIGIELHAEEDSALYVTINNDDTVEIDVKYRGQYSSVDTDAIGLGTKVFTRYVKIAD